MSIQGDFEKIGGKFLTSAEEISSALTSVHCYVFDWDGVFNNGTKIDENGSPFSEPDSMGINMLRFSHWLKYGQLPITAIITGANNKYAHQFAVREHLDAVYINAKDKRSTLTHLSDQFNVSPDQSAFVFDDILDLNAVELCKIAFCIKRDSSVMLNDFILRKKMCDYMSGHGGGNHAVREVTELIIGLIGNYDTCVTKRMEHSGVYAEYLSQRQNINVHFEDMKSS
jgi:3-deoxy-D-manno-octulosonate 8-phosphate phosphatase (KDO 8-P phosphatase)